MFHQGRAELERDQPLQHFHSGQGRHRLSPNSGHQVCSQRQHGRPGGGHRRGGGGPPADVGAGAAGGYLPQAPGGPAPHQGHPRLALH